MADRSVRVAVTQAEPVWIDLSGGVVKTCKLIIEAAENGAQLVVFPETWIPGYPCWIWNRSMDPDLYSEYVKNSLAVKSSEMDKIRRCALENNVTVSLGFAENDHKSLYISQALIGPNGDIKTHRRKWRPTHMERAMFGDSAGDCLKNVAEVPFGRVGSLVCWENIQPLPKFQTMLQHEDVHVSAWPPLYPHAGRPTPWSMSAEGCRNISSNYAIESGSFVLHCTSIITDKGINTLKTGGGEIMSSPGGGDSAVFGPDGRCLTESTDPSSETILYADLCMDDLNKIRMFAGHHSCLDLLRLGVSETC